MHRWLAHPKVSRLNQERAWQMRHNLSPAEQKLWRELSGEKLGVAVHRQVVVGRYILDFLVPSKHLAASCAAPCGGCAAAQAGPLYRRVLARLGLQR